MDGDWPFEFSSKRCGCLSPMVLAQCLLASRALWKALVSGEADELAVSWLEERDVCGGEEGKGGSE